MVAFHKGVQTMFALILWGCTAAKSPEETSSAQTDDAVVSNEPADTSDPSDPAQPSDTEPSEPSDAEPSEPDDGPAEQLAIIGVYTDSIGSEHRITDSRWVIDYGPSEEYSYLIRSYDNASQTVIAENGPDNDATETGRWSRFDWHINGSELWVCQTANTASTEAEAVATPEADSTNLTLEGCRPFGWWQLF